MLDRTDCVDSASQLDKWSADPHSRMSRHWRREYECNAHVSDPLIVVRGDVLVLRV
jgi:hypothetical protein